LKPKYRRYSQLAIGITILSAAIILGYFSIEEKNNQNQKYDIYLVIDVSGSMATCLDGDWVSGCNSIGVTNDSPITFAKKAAIEFVDIFQLDQSSNHRIGLAIFHGTPSDPVYPISKIIVDLDNDSKKLKEGIDNLQPLGATAMGDGISIAIESLSQNTRQDVKKIIVLLSDGASNVGSDPLIAAEIAKENDVTIFSVGYGDSTDVQTLKYVASITGGEYYNAPTGIDLARIFNKIADGLISPVAHYGSRALILIAVPILLFMPTLEKMAVTMIQKAEETFIDKKRPSTKNCSKCTYSNRVNSKFCAKCGNKIWLWYDKKLF